MAPIVGAQAAQSIRSSASPRVARLAGGRVLHESTHVTGEQRSANGDGDAGGELHAAVEGHEFREVAPLEAVDEGGEHDGEDEVGRDEAERGRRMAEVRLA